MKRLDKNITAFAAMIALLTITAAWQALTPAYSRKLGVRPQNSSLVSATAVPPSTYFPPPYDSFIEIEQRPLFSADRRPPTSQQVAPAIVTSPPLSLDKYTVIGIIAAPARATALIRGQANEAIHLRAGQSFEGWTVEAILPRKILFVSGDQKQTLEFKTNKPQQGQHAP